MLVGDGRGSDEHGNSNRAKAFHLSEHVTLSMMLSAWNSLSWSDLDMPQHCKMIYQKYQVDI